MLFAWMLCAVWENPTSAAPDLIIRNANIVTINSNRPTAKAIAISGNTILAVGGNREIARLAGPDTKTINARGRTVLPGLYDSHVHSYRAAASELNSGAPRIHSIAEAQDWIRAKASKKPDGSWILLERVYASRLTEQRLPTKAELDLAAPRHPVHWNSGPVSVVNSKALELSGITRDTPDPLPGQIVKDSKSGEPTGLLRNAAHLLKTSVSAYKPSAEVQRAAVKQLHALYNQQGITSIGERRTDFEAIDLFRDMARRGELTVRVNCTRLLDPVATIEDGLHRLEQLTRGPDGKGAYGPTGAGDDWVRIGPLKVQLDGGMLIGTAYMREPRGVTDIYQITDPNYRGLLNFKPEVLNPLYLEAARRGWQLTAHCTGEASVDVLLDCYEEISRKLDIRERRFLITHANFAFADTFARCARLGVGADIQPAWLYKDGATLLKVLGERRMAQFQPLQSWMRHGLVIGGGSDHMVQTDSIHSTNPWNPWLGMWITLTRQTERAGALNPSEKLSREQALRFYTLNNAHLHFEENKKGSLEPGKLADLIIADRNPLTCPINDLRETKVLLTMVGGRIVWQSPGFVK